MTVIDHREEPEPTCCGERFPGVGGEAARIGLPAVREVADLLATSRGRAESTMTQTMDRPAGTGAVQGPRCRMTNARGDQCTGEALDADPKAIKICTRHAAEVMELIAERRRAVRTRRPA